MNTSNRERTCVFARYQWIALLCGLATAVASGCVDELDYAPDETWTDPVEPDKPAVPNSGDTDKSGAIGNTACFTWDCDPATSTCTFDTSCSVIHEGSVWRYLWDFGDGSGAHTTSSSVVTHQYPYKVNSADVSLVDYMWTGPEPGVSCRIVIRNVISPPQPTKGQCQGYTVTIVPAAADAYVAQDQPNANFGTQDHLSIRSTATGYGRYSFMKFNVPSAVQDVVSASLRVRTMYQPIPSAAFYRVNNMNWTETGVTWNNWQGPTTYYDYLTTLDNLAANAFYEIDVTSSVAPGTRTFGMASSTDQAGLDFRSREGSYGPELEIVFE